MAGRFRYLNLGLGLILGFVGLKMLIAEWYHVPTVASLAVIAIVLAVTIGLSLRAEGRDASIEEVIEEEDLT
jgi:tellurite resistance protein TerC